MSDVIRELEDFAKAADCDLVLTVGKAGRWSIGTRCWTGGLVTEVEDGSLENAHRNLVRNALGRLEADAILIEERNAEFEQKRATFRALAKKL